MRYKVFLDSNVYDGANYSFRNALFTALKNRAQAGNLELQINSVVEGEVRQHINNNIKKAAKELLEAVRNPVLSGFKNIPGYADKIQIENPKEWAQKAVDEFELFLTECSVKRISTNGVDVERILADYFANPQYKPSQIEYLRVTIWEKLPRGIIFLPNRDGYSLGKGVSIVMEQSENTTKEEIEGLFEEDPERKNAAVARRVQKKKRVVNHDKKYDVQVIPATVGVTPEGETAPIRRCAAYCRVSTDQEAQSSSYELQCKHYTEYIESRDDLVLVKVYADEGLSGTQMKHRDQFLQMVSDCEAGMIDLVLTKSLSRFSRNVVDCLSTIRKLKALNPPVEVFFEKENLSSLDDKTDMVLAMMASIAQEESRSISANISWAIRKRMENGTQKIPTACLLGYATDEDGNMVIVEEEAKIVKFIYKNFILGIHPNVIAEKLNKQGSTTVLGNPWTGMSVRNILQNEKYCGDVLMQKTFTDSYLTHKVKKNNGERQQFFIADHHDAIVSREVWDKAKAILEKMNYKNWKRQSQQRLIPLAVGLLAGYIVPFRILKASGNSSPFVK